ncbi:MAG: succinylglutamate desuccinylase/aspartoacylase family protein [Cyclobacteriaceae bacterium]
MIINRTEILPGETLRIDVNIAKLPSLSPIDIPITVSRSRNPGPVVLLSGGLHGDEINGIEIVRRMVERGMNIPVRGTIICIPIINIYGFIHFSRYVPDGKDVNRSFPGNKNGSLASRVAYYLMKDIIPKIDYGLDFHTGGADRTNFPQIRTVMSDPENAELAAAFNAPFTIDSAYRPKSIRKSAARLGKKILVYEGGESARFDEHAIEIGIEGAVRFLRHMKMTHFKSHKPKYQNQLVKHSSWIRSRASGLFLTDVKSGEFVKKNHLIGYISDPFGAFKLQIKSPFDGYVIGLNNNPIVHQGDAIVHLGAV